MTGRPACGGSEGAEKNGNSGRATRTTEYHHRNEFTRRAPASMLNIVRITAAFYSANAVYSILPRVVALLFMNMREKERESCAFMCIYGIYVCIRTHGGGGSRLFEAKSNINVNE